MSSFGQAERAAAAREAEQKAREQAGEASPGQDQGGSGQPTEASPSVEDTRPTGSGRFQGPPPGTTRAPGAPPSGSGRGQGRGASLDAANGRLAVPPGMEASREELGGRGSRGRRGRVRICFTAEMFLLTFIEQCVWKVWNVMSILLSSNSQQKQLASDLCSKNPGKQYCI